MNDIITTMFNKKFLEELFKPQELYSKKALRTVFDRLAHASIMRLNQASMDKVRHHVFIYSLCVFNLLLCSQYFVCIFNYKHWLSIHAPVRFLQNHTEMFLSQPFHYAYWIYIRFAFMPININQVYNVTFLLCLSTRHIHLHTMSPSTVYHSTTACIYFWCLRQYVDECVPVHSSMTWWPWLSSIRCFSVHDLRTSSLCPSTTWMQSKTLWKILPAFSARLMRLTDSW